MNKEYDDEELIRILDLETEHSEKYKDFPIQDLYTIEHRGTRTKVLSVRFSESEFEKLQAAAAGSRVTVSVLVRNWIADLLTEESHPTDLKEMAHTLESLSKRLAALG